MSIQPEGPGGVVTCVRCGHQDPYQGDACDGVLACDQCGQSYMHGVARPRFIHNPCEDGRFILQTIDGIDVDGKPVRVTLKLDRTFGGMLARDLLSVCP